MMMMVMIMMMMKKKKKKKKKKKIPNYIISRHVTSRYTPHALVQTKGWGEIKMVYLSTSSK